MEKAATSILNMITSLMSAVRVKYNPAVGRIVTGILALIFVAGLVISMSSAGINIKEFALLPFLILVFVLAPVNVASAAYGLQLYAGALDKTISFKQAFAVSSASRLAELLPLPGGVLVRGGALIKAGASARHSTVILSLGSLLRLSLALVVGSVPLVMSGLMIGKIIFIIATILSVTCSVAIGAIYSIKLSVFMTVLRIVQMGISVLRLVVAFECVGYSISLVNSGLFVASVTLGASTSFVPAGLGVSELIAAASANLVNLSPAAAFLAVAANRFAGISFNALAFALWGRSVMEIKNQ